MRPAFVDGKCVKCRRSWGRQVDLDQLTEWQCQCGAPIRVGPVGPDPEALTPEDARLGSMLRLSLRGKGVTLRRASEIFNVDGQAMSDLFNGRQRFTIGKADRLKVVDVQMAAWLEAEIRKLPSLPEGNPA